MRQAFEEALGSSTIAFLVRQDVQHHPISIHDAPKVMRHVVYEDENLIHMLGIAPLRVKVQTR
jgi:hypothetical protein